MQSSPEGVTNHIYWKWLLLVLTGLHQPEGWGPESSSGLSISLLLVLLRLVIFFWEEGARTKIKEMRDQNVDYGREQIFGREFMVIGNKHNHDIDFGEIS